MFPAQGALTIADPQRQANVPTHDTGHPHLPIAAADDDDDDERAREQASMSGVFGAKENIISNYVR